jgi:ubiquinone/menaquinone biosynthesis C-methylase UbiE
MVRERVVETNDGIQGGFTVDIYDQMQRRFRDKGWMETKAIIRSGINKGSVLEVGPGPGYLGLEWLKQTNGTRLTGLDISPDMISIARRNAVDYGLTERTEYVESDGSRIPFDDNTFDAVFSNGSLHEWSDVSGTLSEIWRVLKPHGRIFISDLRRNMIAPVKWFMLLATKPKAIRPGLITSINASYIKPEVERLLLDSKFDNFSVFCNPMGLQINATK